MRKIAGVIIGTRLVREVADPTDRDAAVRGILSSPPRPATPSPDGFPPVQLVLFTVLGACVAVIAYAFTVSGPICALLFLGGVFTGGSCRSPDRSSTADAAWPPPPPRAYYELQAIGRVSSPL